MIFQGASSGVIDLLITVAGYGRALDGGDSFVYKASRSFPIPPPLPYPLFCVPLLAPSKGEVVKGLSSSPRHVSVLPSLFTWELCEGGRDGADSRV